MVKYPLDFFVSFSSFLSLIYLRQKCFGLPFFPPYLTVIDVAVDIRKGSPTFGQWVSVELSAENHRQFFIPRGFAHGFLTLTDDVEFRYKCDNVYNKPAEGGMRYDAPEVNVDWGSLLNGIEPILSEKDMIGPTLDTSDNQFIYNENC